MGEFAKPVPGDSDELLYNSRYHGAIIDMLGDKDAGNPRDRRRIERNVPRYTIKNTSDTEVPRGGVLELDGFLFNADDNLQNFLSNEPKFKGKKSTAGAKAIAIATEPIPVGKIRSDSVVILGPVPAKVDIVDAAHRFCEVITDDVTKLRSASSGFPMLPAQSGTGTKWALVTLGGGGASASTSAGWGKVVSHSDETEISPFESVDDPPSLGWGWINPCDAPSLPTDPDDAPDPEDLATSIDSETFLPVYNLAPEEIEPGVEVDIYVFWIALPSGHRFVICQFCVEATGE